MLMRLIELQSPHERNCTRTQTSEDVPGPSPRFQVRLDSRYIVTPGLIVSGQFPVTLSARGRHCQSGAKICAFRHPLEDAQSLCMVDQTDGKHSDVCTDTTDVLGIPDLVQRNRLSKQPRDKSEDHGGLLEIGDVGPMWVEAACMAPRSSM